MSSETATPLSRVGLKEVSFTSRRTTPHLSVSRVGRPEQGRGQRGGARQKEESEKRKDRTLSRAGEAGRSLSPLEGRKQRKAGIREGRSKEREDNGRDSLNERFRALMSYDFKEGLQRMGRDLAAKKDTRSKKSVTFVLPD